MSTLNLRPLGDRVVVQSVEEEDQTFAGGKLVLPETAKEKPQKGKIIAVGKGKIGEDGTIRPLDVKAGDVVLFGKYSGTEITYEGTEYLIMRESDVYAVI